MAVPKKRTSHSKKRMRSSGKGLKPTQYFLDDMGVACLSHRITTDGKYNGRQIITPKIKNTTEASGEYQTSLLD